MKRWKFVFFLLALLLAGSVAAQGPNPTHDGEFAVPGLNDRVEILRDEWGVPHIYASNTHDLFFAQGYTQAMDRWWQMEFYRNAANGSIQKLTGRIDGLMGTDVYMRTLGFRQVVEQEIAENLSADTLAILQAFADGVNAYIVDRPATELAFEYNLLRTTGVNIEIEPWTPADSIMWGKMMSLQLSGNQGTEQLLASLTAALPEDILAFWNVEWPFGEKPTIILEEELPMLEAATDTAYTPGMGTGITGTEITLAGGFSMDDSSLPLATGPGIGSNNWVVHGDLTDSGLPLLANDMHLSVQMPSIWYEIGLHCQPVSDACPFEVAGFTFAPTPGIVAGHNARIAWAHTNVGPDTQDLYQLRVNPDNPLQYEWDGEWRDMTIRDETLAFGDGSEPLTFQVRETHLGPIINDQPGDFNNDNPMALRWTALEPGTLFEALIRLNLASDWDEFREAVRYWDTPSQNIVYADIDGNIGYQVPGRIPIRATDHTGLLPMPGWTSDYEWRGYLPYELLPRLFNPARGYVATANQAIVPLAYYDWLNEQLADDYGTNINPVISQRWAYGYRGERINAMIEELAPHSADTFIQMHGDNYDGSAAEVLPFVLDLAVEDETLTDLLQWLGEWDNQMHMDSPQAAFYAHFWVRMVDNLYNDRLAEAGRRADGANNEWWAAYLLLQDPDNPWWDDTRTSETETRDDILLKSLNEALANITAELGEDRDTWRWGDLHTTTFVSDPLGQSGLPPIERIVNRGPVATSGTGSAINATGWSAASPGFEAYALPSERVIYDLSDWDASLSMHTTGQSGHPASTHYDDMIDPWRLIEYRPMVWSREAVEAATVNTLVLEPGE